MKYLSLCFVLAAATTAAAQTPSGKGDDKILREPVTLTGCVTAGKEANTYLLSNVQRPDKAPGAADPSVVYWLSPHDKLKGHVGQQVQVIGKLDDDVKTSKVKEEDGKVELKNGSRKVEVPEGTAAAEAVGTAGTTRTTYKVEVKSVKMLSGSCSS